MAKCYLGVMLLRRVFIWRVVIWRNVIWRNVIWRDVTEPWEEDINLNPRGELNGQGRLVQNTTPIFSVIIFIDRPSL